MDIKMKVKIAKSVLPDLANLSIPPEWENAEIEFSSDPKPLWASEEDDEESEDQ